MVPPADDCPLPTPLVSGAASFLLLLSACNAPIAGGQTGDGSGFIPEPESSAELDIASVPDCEYVNTEVEPDEETPLGFKANDVREYAEDTFLTDIEWLRDPYSGLGYGPETAGGLTITVEALDGPPLLREQKPDAGAGALCPPRLALPVEITVVSEGGALEEAFDAYLEASTVELAQFTAVIPAADLDGSLRLRNAPADTEIDTVTLAGFVSPQGTAGSVLVTTRTGEPSGDDVALDPTVGNTAMAAHWPKQSCDNPEFGYVEPSLVVEPDSEIRGESFEDLVEDMNARSPVPLRWSNGDETRFNFELQSERRVCATPDLWGALRLRGAVSVKLWTDDVKIDGTLPGMLRDEPGADGEHYLSVFGVVNLPPAEFAELVTLDGISIDRFDQVDFSFYLSGSDSLSGSLSIGGTTVCDTEPPAEELGGCFAPIVDAGLGSLEEISPTAFE